MFEVEFCWICDWFNKFENYYYYYFKGNFSYIILWKVVVKKRKVNVFIRYCGLYL